MTHPDFYVFGLVDGAGDLIRCVVEDEYDTICIDGYLPADHPKDPGSEFHFESDAYHLDKWAKENGMVPFKHGYKFDQLSEPWRVY
jgi:hypothetical protein